MSADKSTTTALEVAAAAEANVVGEIVAAELADALDTFWMALDDRLVYRGVSEESVAAGRPRRSPAAYAGRRSQPRRRCRTTRAATPQTARKGAALQPSTSPVEVAEEFLVWIDQVLEKGRRHGHP